MKRARRANQYLFVDKGDHGLLLSPTPFFCAVCFLLPALWVLCVGPHGTVYAKDLADLKHYIGEQDAVLVADGRGEILFSKNAQKKLIPASTLKILTSLVSLYYLGADYRFTTEFYLDQNENLLVKGYGDPLLVSEVLLEIADVFKTKLIKFNDLVLDDSYFGHPVTIPGVSSSFEPYDAPNGALCVNFNTIYFKKDDHGRYESAEPQTPLLPVVLDRVKKSQLKSGRIVLSAEKKGFLMYAGHLMLYFLKEKGIASNGRVRIGRVSKGKDTLIFKYRSRFSLKEIVIKLLDHSNNFMANQIMIGAGTKIYGPPGTLEKGVRLVSNYAEQILKINGIHIVEGSGISRNNRISAENFDKILKAFEPYHNLMPRKDRAFYKTGTLNGIRTMAGYIANGQERLYRFTLLFNTPGKTTQQVLDRILKAID